MPPSVTPTNFPVKLPASASWWVMLGTLTSLLLAGHALRPKALAQATALRQPSAAPTAHRPQSPAAPAQVLRAGGLAARTAGRSNSF